MVQIHVSQLRKALPPGVLVTRPGGYALVVEPESIDLVRFERLRDAGRAALPRATRAAAARLLGEALALWRGEALAEFSEPFAVLEAARLAQLRLDCVEDRIDAELALGHHAAVTAELEALVAREPLRERARAQLMLALYRGGRHADALATLHDLRRTLDEELGLVPSAALGELEQRILRHDAVAPGPRTVMPAPERELGGRACAGAGGRGRRQRRPRRTSPGRAERRRVTAVALSFAEGDALAGALDAEDLRRAARGCARRRTAEIVERLGGGLGPASGDQIIAGFGDRGRARGRRAAGGARSARAARRDPGGRRRRRPRGAAGRCASRSRPGWRSSPATCRRRRHGLRRRSRRRRLLGAQAPAGAVVLGPAAARARPRHDGPAARQRRRDGGARAKRRRAPPARRARRSSGARRSSRSWPSAIAAPRRAAGRSCSSSASRASASRASWTSCRATRTAHDGRGVDDVPVLAGPHEARRCTPWRPCCARTPSGGAPRAGRCGLPRSGGRAPRDAARAGRATPRRSRRSRCRPRSSTAACSARSPTSCSRPGDAAPARARLRGRPLGRPDDARAARAPRPGARDGARARPRDDAPRARARLGRRSPTRPSWRSTGSARPELEAARRRPPRRLAAAARARRRDRGAQRRRAAVRGGARAARCATPARCAATGGGWELADLRGAPAVPDTLHDLLLRPPGPARHGARSSPRSARCSGGASTASCSTRSPGSTRTWSTRGSPGSWTPSFSTRADAARPRATSSSTLSSGMRPTRRCCAPRGGRCTARGARARGAAPGHRGGRTRGPRPSPRRRRRARAGGDLVAAGAPPPPAVTRPAGHAAARSAAPPPAISAARNAASWPTPPIECDVIRDCQRMPRT